MEEIHPPTIAQECKHKTYVARTRKICEKDTEGKRKTKEGNMSRMTKNREREKHTKKKQKTNKIRESIKTRKRNKTKALWEMNESINAAKTCARTA